MAEGMQARWRRLALGGAVYVSQGTIFGFAGFVLIPTMAARGVALEVQAGVLALAGVPWVVKILWALLLDTTRFAGTSSRLVIAAASGAMAVLACGIALVDDPFGSVETVAWLWLGLNVAASLQDVATDALMIDEVPRNDRGLAEGVILGGHHLGAEGLGALALGAVFGSRGFGAAFGLVALGLALVGLLAVAEHRANPRMARARKLDLSALLQLLAQPRAWAVGGFAGLILLADVVTSTVVGQFLVGELEWPSERITNVLAPLLLVANLASYLLAARVSDRLGHTRTLVAGGVALGLLWVTFAGLSAYWPSLPFMYGFVVLQALATALMYVGLHAWLMDATDTRIRATHFAALTALLNLPRVLAPPLAPALLAALGFAGLYACCGGFQVLLALALLGASSLKDTRA